jgi:hypothetical protein
MLYHRYRQRCEGRNTSAVAGFIISYKVEKETGGNMQMIHMGESYEIP